MDASIFQIISIFLAMSLNLLQLIDEHWGGSQTDAPAHPKRSADHAECSNEHLALATLKHMWHLAHKCVDVRVSWCGCRDKHVSDRDEYKE